jgi:hypothetical protein
LILVACRAGLSGFRCTGRLGGCRADVPEPVGAETCATWPDAPLAARPRVRQIPRPGLDDIHAVARCRLIPDRDGRSPGRGHCGPGRTRSGPGPGAAANTLASPAAGARRQLAPVTAFGVTIADIMLHGRHDDPDPGIAGWLADNTASRRSTSSPADVLIHWAREIARITGCSERTIRQLLTSAGLRHPAPLPDSVIDPRWLREQYQDRRRSLKDIAAETGTPVEDLAATARKAGVRVRHGVNGRAHPLAAFGGPGAFPPDVWSVFAHPGAEQRIRRLLILPGQPSLLHAARQLGVRTAILTSQVRQLETAVGTALLRTGPDGRLALTAYGQLFACDVTPALKMLSRIALVGTGKGPVT